MKKIGIIYYKEKDIYVGKGKVANFLNHNKLKLKESTKKIYKMKDLKIYWINTNNETMSIEEICNKRKFDYVIKIESESTIKWEEEVIEKIKCMYDKKYIYAINQDNIVSKVETYRDTTESGFFKEKTDAYKNLLEKLKKNLLYYEKKLERTKKDIEKIEENIKKINEEKE